MLAGNNISKRKELLLLCEQKHVWYYFRGIAGQSRNLNGRRTSQNVPKSWFRTSILILKLYWREFSWHHCLLTLKRLLEKSLEFKTRNRRVTVHIVTSSPVLINLVCLCPELVGTAIISHFYSRSLLFENKTKTYLCLDKRKINELSCPEVFRTQNYAE